MPRRQRHTARRVHDRLVAEHGFRGSYPDGAALRACLAADEPRAGRRVRGAGAGAGKRADGFRSGQGAPGRRMGRRPLPGGRVSRIRTSGTWRACPRRTRNASAGGLMAIFGHIGGAPRTLVIDNASGAGHRDARGEVTLTRVFEAFICRYRMDVRFCNPYSGNEKGGVGNAVGFLRRNPVGPAPGRRDPRAADPSHARQMRRARQGHPLPDPGPDRRPGRRRPGRAAPPAVRPLRPGQMGDPQDGQVRVRRDRRQPVPDRPGHARAEGGRGHPRHRHHGQGPGRAHHRRTIPRLRQERARSRTRPPCSRRWPGDPGPGTTARYARTYPTTSGTISTRPTTRPSGAASGPYPRPARPPGPVPATQAAQHALDLGRAIDETETPILAGRFADGGIDYGDCLPDLTAYDTSDHPGRESA